MLLLLSRVRPGATTLSAFGILATCPVSLLVTPVFIVGSRLMLLTYEVEIQDLILSWPQLVHVDQKSIVAIRTFPLLIPKIV